MILGVVWKWRRTFGGESASEPALPRPVEVNGLNQVACGVSRGSAILSQSAELKKRKGDRLKSRVGGAWCS